MFLEIPNADFFTDILAFNKEILNDSLNSSSSYMLTAKLIAGVGLLIGVLITYRKILQDGVEVELPKFLGKFLLIFLGILFYGTLVRFINVPLDVINGSITATVKKEYDNTTNYFESFQFQTSEEYLYNAEMEKELAEYELIMGNPNENSVSDNRRHNRNITAIKNKGQRQNEEQGLTIWNYMKGDGIDSIKRAVMGWVYQIVFYLGSVAIMVLNFVRTFFLTVLTIFGIFTIAISAFPGFEGSFNKWLQNYINVYLWLPIGYILQALISKMYTHLNPRGELFSTDNLSMLVFGLLGIVSYATVPYLSNLLVSAAVSQLASKSRGKAQNVASKGASGAGKGASSAGAGIKSGVNAIKSKFSNSSE